ncbi:MAG: hypothetical protein FJ029_14875 [Actinobacteria bacterium]|nr:hypothetical protein [Actinomycetota bacterium]
MSDAASQAVPLRVFLSGIIQGSAVDASHHRQDYRDELRRIIGTVHPDAEVICPVELNPNSAAYDEALAQATFFRELELAASADVTVAYAPVATMGTAVEMLRAFEAGHPVLTISPMAHNWAIRFLSTRVFPDLAAFRAFVDGGGLRAVLARARAGALR